MLCQHGILVLSLISYHVWSGGVQSESVSDPESETLKRSLQADEDENHLAFVQ